MNKIAPSSAPIKQKSGDFPLTKALKKAEIENAKGGVIS